MRAVRARSRVSAYVYGNTTALGAVLAVEVTDASSGRGALVVAVTCLTTFVAHVLSDAVSVEVAAPGADPQELAHHLREELRDAVPVASSGALPVLLLLVAAAGWMDARLAIALAEVELVVRQAATGLVVARVSGRRASAGTLWWGLASAVVSVVVASVKAAFGH